MGAGLAGLNAAVALRDAGWEVVVLEARPRVGGRVYTLYEPFTDGIHVEAGGESIDVSHLQIQALVRRFGLSLAERPADKEDRAVVYRARTRVPVEQFLAETGGRVGKEVAGFDDSVANAVPNLDPANPTHAPDAEKWDHTTLEDFLRRQHLHPQAEFVVRTVYRSEYNAELDRLSMLFVAQQVVQTNDQPTPDSERYRIAAGNSSLPQAMARYLGSSVVLNAPLTRVEQHDWGVRLRAGTHQVDAAHVILATPPATLRPVVFAPKLPNDVTAMIAGLDLGQALKVARQYSERFWNDLGQSGFILTDLPFHVSWDATDSMPGKAGVLTQFITANSATKGARQTPSQRIDDFGAQLDRVYPEGIPLKLPPVATMAWQNERYTTGGYSVYGPGQLTRFWSVVRRPTGRIWFAGEHTEALSGFMESAVRSGARVAQAIGPARRQT